MKKLIVMVSLLALLNIDFIQSMENVNEKYSLIDISDDAVKNELLADIINTITCYKNSDEQLIIAIALIQAGANPNTLSMGESLLHKALLVNADVFVIGELLDLDADYRHQHYITGGPIFFDASTVEIAELFINKGVDVNSVNGNDHNVLWHVMESKFPVELVRFYLEHNVNVNHVDKWDGACVLHSFAAYKEVKDGDVFLAKARLIFEASPALVTIVDKNGKTPIAVAEDTIKTWGKEKEYSAGESLLQKLINLFKTVV